MRKPSQPGNNRRLWMVNHYAIAPDMPGGSRHYELARLLGEQGWSTTIFATPFNYSTARFVRNVSPVQPFLTEVEDGVSYRWLYSVPYSGNNWRRYLNMVSFTASFLLAAARGAKPDTVLGSSPHLLAALGAWMISKRYKVPFVFEVRDLWPDTLVQMGLTNPLIIKPLSVIERFLYRQADLILVLTSGIARGIEEKGVSREKIVFLPNAPFRPSPIDMKERERVRRRLGWSDKVVAIYAGVHGPANALDRVVEAARRLDGKWNVQIVFLGDGPTKESLKELARGSRNVTFLDPVPKAEVASLLRAADIGLLSLLQTQVFEGARPNKLFDYLSSGLPVVSTVEGEVMNVLHEAGAGVYAPPEELDQAVRRLASDPSQRVQMGISAHEYANSSLSREGTAALLAQHLNQVASCSER